MKFDSSRMWQMHPAFAIFDMDGTLVDSMKYWMRLGEEYLRMKGVSDADAAPVLARLAEQTISQSSALMVRTFHWNITPQEVADEINGLMQEHYRRDVPLKQGVRAYLGGLAAAGVRCCVASASDPDNVRLCLGRSRVADAFEFSLSCEVYGSKSKPDIYLACARRFGAAPQDIVVYEDALYALRTAKAAGFSTVGILDTWDRQEWPLIREVSDVVTEDFRTFSGREKPFRNGLCRLSGGLDSLRKRK